MSNQPKDRILADNLAYWYLFAPKTFHVSLEQLTEMYEYMKQPMNLGKNYTYVNGKFSKLPNSKREQHAQVLKQMEEIAQNVHK